GNPEGEGRTSRRQIEAPARSLTPWPPLSGRRPDLSAYDSGMLAASAMIAPCWFGLRDRLAQSATAVTHARRLGNAPATARVTPWRLMGSAIPLTRIPAIIPTKVHARLRHA